ncbi:MAG: penicillin-binding protein activator, partial [Hyphomonadaceae bacterium]|nr:penicillin-binding protein activator [Hyphomonadaceae bacterium]
MERWMVGSLHCAGAPRSPSCFSPSRFPLRCGAAALLALLLAGCATTPQGSVGAARTQETREPAARPQPGSRTGLTPPFLAGKPVQRVGVLLNFSALPTESEGLYNAAELALFEENDASLLMIPRDAGAGAAGAATATQALGADGVEVIIGPLLRDSVLGARDAAKRAEAPLLAFSNDRAVAGGGAFLLSFQSEEEVARIVAFAVQQGLRRIAVLSPDSEYGRRADAEARRVAQLSGGQVVAGQLYSPTAAGAAQAAKLLASPALA